MGYTEATPIQAGAIPIVLQGRDLIGCASTGTGKTAAFLLPVLQLLNNGDHGRCRALVLSPTRELALQIDEQALALGYHLGLSAAAVVGGLDMGPQERALRAGAAIIVATPGRLLDHMRFDYVDLSSVEIVVLDEADRMLDMGFLPDIRRILNALPKKRQTLLFSATMSPTIRRLADDILVDPAEITVDRQAPAAAITQTLHPVLQERKTALLTQILQHEGMESVIVFVRRKIDVNQVASAIRRVGINAGAIHSGRTQEDRIAALEGFRSGQHPVLVATDVAARGLDVSGISHVINFDVPHSPEDYIHRAGRTARAGATGDVITFVSPGEEERLRDIEREIGTELPRTIVPGFEFDGAEMGAGRGRRGPAGGRGRGGQGGPERSRSGGDAGRGERSGRGGRGGRGSGRGDSATPAPVGAEATSHESAGEEAGGHARTGGGHRRRSSEGASDAAAPAVASDATPGAEGATTDGEGAPRRRRRRGGRGGRGRGAAGAASGGEAATGASAAESPSGDSGRAAGDRPRRQREGHEARSGEPRSGEGRSREGRPREGRGRDHAADATPATARHRHDTAATKTVAAKPAAAKAAPAREAEAKPKGLRQRLARLASALTGRSRDDRA